MAKRELSKELSKELNSFIRCASREAVINGVSQIKTKHINLKKLITKSNPLDINSIKNVKKHADSRNTYRISNSNINTYLAASSLAHLLDGWSYLSESFYALLNGDEGSSIHLAYYAELRSAMAILASEGIGVFNDKHLSAHSINSDKEFPRNYYKSTGGYEQPKNPTHQFVWHAMDKWTSSTVKASPELLKAFKVKGKNFHELIEFFHPLTSTSDLLTSKIIKSWLKEWSLDIKMYKDDREARNVASYRPQRIKNFSQQIDFENIINSINNYWTVISPSISDNFDLLDRYLLRILFDNLYEHLNSTTTLTSPKKELIIDSFSAFGINDSVLFSFLNGEAPHNTSHSIFLQAKEKRTTALSILARATLLLRVAIGLISQLYKAGGLNKNDLEFVWNRFGVDNGFWSNTSSVTDFNSLWFDIQPLFSDLKNDMATGGDNSPFSLKQRNPECFLYFGQIHRACLWGLDF